MELAEVFGYAGMITGVSFLLPQIYKTWKTKSVEDLSWGMLSIVLLNCVFWFMYGLLLASAPLMLTNGISFLTITTQILLKFRYRNNP